MKMNLKAHTEANRRERGTAEAISNEKNKITRALEITITAAVAAAAATAKKFTQLCYSEGKKDRRIENTIYMHKERV